MTMVSMANTIRTIKAGDDMVTDRKHIMEFVVNADRTHFDSIRKHLEGIKANSEIKPLKIKCNKEACGNEYTQPFTLDMSNFFV